MGANYNRIAGIYDTLARLVYGKAIEQAQQYLLKHIPSGARILIVGGGTGWILEELTRVHKRGLQIVYVELSSAMIVLARKRNLGLNQISFINCDILSASLDNHFDVVITPFVLDNFSNKTLEKVFRKIDQHLKKGGLWLFADFQQQPNRPDQKLLLKVMYLFFGIFCNLEVKRLPDTALLFQRYFYRLVSNESFYRGFITAVTFEK